MNLYRSFCLLAVLVCSSKAVVLDLDFIKKVYPDADPATTTKLEFYKMNLTSIQPGAFSTFINLEKISISYNPNLELTPESFDGLGNLKMLSLTNNKMTDLSGSLFRSGLRSLPNLVLNDNEIAALTRNDFVGLEGLKNLYLMGNKIETIEDGTFQELGQLEELLIATNPLRAVNEHTLDGLVKLKRLSIHDGMSGNSKLTYIDKNAFKNLPELKEVQLPYKKFNASYFESFDLNGRKGTYSKPWSAYWELFTIQ
jgi:Leucine-rich repeat (LRR) protein